MQWLGYAAILIACWRKSRSMATALLVCVFAKVNPLHIVTGILKSMHLMHSA